ncbi:MAG: thymidine phosphorylase [Clostridiales bacterium]|nr:thymidine phosphorylase [Clostridiales bacterium]
MDIKNIIDKKSKNKELTKDEIEFFVDGYTNGAITDYQASALLMAIKIFGMTEKETFALTNAMLHSGEIIDLADIGMVVDKHSTGGVSDTTTLALAPICAEAGIKMLKLSGRGLGFTGGTIDKVESFKGYQVEIDMGKAKELTLKNGACVIAASKNLAPADKKLYALRDTTATVESLPLIASSIMSKKLASGADAIVLDVKYGNGAFMKTKKDAVQLAKLMVKIGENAGKKMDYIVDDMNEPLGYNIGNRLEAYEVIELLNGKKGKLRDVTLALCAKCIRLGLDISYEQAYQKAVDALDSKRALKRFKQMIADQGGDLELFKGLKLKPTLKIKATASGILNKIDCAELGRLVGLMGATRQKITDQIDYNVGVRTFHKLGDKIEKGDVVFEVFAKNKEQANEFAEKFLNCYHIV